MSTINLKEHYPTTYTEDFLLKFRRKSISYLLILSVKKMLFYGKSTDIMHIIHWMIRIFQ